MDVNGECVASEQHPALHQPHLRQLLSTLGLDVTFHRAEGLSLYFYDQTGREVDVLDFVGGYGAALFGHAQPDLADEATSFFSSQRPVLTQGSISSEAECLVAELNEHCRSDQAASDPMYRVVFGNSGAEAIEAALKHALLETGGDTLIALEQGFHGKTLGALQLTDNLFFREPFQLPTPHVVRVPANDLDALAETFNSVSRPAGMILEPIQGEGGVRPLTAEFAKRAARLCQDHNVPLIADECQTGMGRTGSFLASQPLGVQADYVLLAKSLGGGLAKISAALISTERYVDGFELRHSSTFAADAFSCRIARRALRLLTSATLKQIHEQGEFARDKLRQIATRHATVIADVRGAGLMIGLEFKPQPHSESFLMRLFGSQHELVRVICGYLFHRYRVRVAPTLSDPWTLRLQPPMSVSKADWQRLFDGIEDVCRRIATEDAIGLTDYVLDKGDQRPRRSLLRTDASLITFDTAVGRRVACHRTVSRTPRVGWLCHMIDAEDLIQQETEVSAGGFEMVEQYLDRWSPLASPVVMNAVDVESSTGERLCLFPILLPVTSRMMKTWLDRRDFALGRSLIDQGVHLARQLNCQLVALGQYTSILTRAGRELSTRHELGVTSGNSYATQLAIEAVHRVLQSRGQEARRSVLGIVGAAGNIGRTCVELLGPAFESTLLVGSPRSARRLRKLAGRTPRSTATVDLRSLRAADVVVSAVNAAHPPLDSECLGPGSIVCDLSVPASVAGDVTHERPDVTVIRGGVARLPNEEDLGIASFPLPPGLTFACMAEGILLGYEGVSDRTFTGALSESHVSRVAEMARRHSFQLADLKTTCVFGSERRETTYAAR